MLKSEELLRADPMWRAATNGVRHRGYAFEITSSGLFDRLLAWMGL